MQDLQLHPHFKLAIVGMGDVGATYAYTLMLRGTVDEMVLINRNHARAEGEAMDLKHGLSLASPMEIYAGTYEDAHDAHLVVITAGAAQEPGESRLDLAGKNAAITKQIVHEVLKYNPDPILLMVNNPVDVMTYVALKESGLPPSQVIGSGTVLDSSRFRYLLSSHCSIDPRSVHGYIVGEHGDSEFAPWSRVNIAGVPINQYCPACGACDTEYQSEIVEKVRNAAYEIIERKGSTYYAIALAMERITRSIFRNDRGVMPVSALMDGQYGILDSCISIPRIVGRTGIEGQVLGHLEDNELEQLEHSASVVRQTIRDIGY